MNIFICHFDHEYMHRDGEEEGEEEEADDDAYPVADDIFTVMS